jgi:hypothetical protein
MKSVYVLAPGEDWIVDRFVKEWNQDNFDISVARPEQADIIWLMSDWCWNRIPGHLLFDKKVITTIHHIVPEKFSKQEQNNFALRDTFTDVYHVPNEHTKAFIEPLTSKPIYVINYWANNNIWKPTSTREAIRNKYDIMRTEYIVGSFQRDTEGSDLKSPKLEKGPDLLADFLETLNKKRGIHVMLAGWRRQYIIERLNKADIGYTYIERPSQEIVNELYQTLDLYPVTARQEGGPQSLIECGLLGVNVVSRDIGIARQILPSSAINDDVSLAIPAIPNVDNLKLPMGYEPYRKLIESL